MKLAVGGLNNVWWNLEVVVVAVTPQERMQQYFKDGGENLAREAFSREKQVVMDERKSINGYPASLSFSETATCVINRAKRR